jgi:hypothetical protein
LRLRDALKPETSILETLFLRCFEQWLTMCKGVVIIKRFRELSLAMPVDGCPVGCATAWKMGSGETLAEL